MGNDYLEIIRQRPAQEQGKRKFAQLALPLKTFAGSQMLCFNEAISIKNVTGVALQISKRRDGTDRRFRFDMLNRIAWEAGKAEKGGRKLPARSLNLGFSSGGMEFQLRLN
ncbi:hypothetical protein ColTof4_00107 [Colletotrichum tofieldiae]|nr:hypothetical protein ColTof3_07304 [Colletotrichum tofieldiae]GKT67684.1 hypothetical protein ColTof4_00107 [Colletotrichum tofieldiae]GKT91360.1 hypothetical protein Ct61P_09210 [Colletotrichum tofieldiae]